MNSCKCESSEGSCSGPRAVGMCDASLLRAVLCCAVLCLPCRWGRCVRKCVHAGKGSQRKDSFVRSWYSNGTQMTYLVISCFDCD